MPFIIKPVTTVVREKTVTTNQGEVTINLNLMLTLVVDQNGTVSVSATPQTPSPMPTVPISAKPTKPEYVIQIPDIEVTDNLILDFGKDV
jgi:hypothetical protein